MSLDGVSRQYRQITGLGETVEEPAAVEEVTPVAEPEVVEEVEPELDEDE